MTDRRRWLLVLLVPLFALPVLLAPFGGIGEVEVALWILLMTGWVVAFLFWARPRPDGQG